ncbi:MAG: tetratricopeptide repeat protein [Tannerellaceae bacterium]|jgi:tetratricopeptide (TPR) repeat protein|nr:tetratricopeptide repeat protein [Tannerellaceae bacterium]
MKDDDYSILLERYLSALEKGKDAYFDADEILYLLDCFEDENDLVHYDGVLEIGLKLHPTRDELRIKKCRSLIINEHYKEALALAENIQEKYNQELDIIRLECYFYLNDYETAYLYLEELVIDLSCTYIEELFEFFATFLNDLEMIDAAETLIQYGLLGFPDNIILNNELCYLYELKGDIEEAINVCNKIIDQNPYSYEFWFTLGRLYSLQYEYEKAIDAFDFACACDKPDTELLMSKAYCLFMNENYNKAIEIYNEFLPLTEENSHVRSLIAECYIKLEDFEHAYRLLKDIIQQENNAEANTYINCIRCCVETDREREASQLLLKATDLFPDNVRILSLLALTYLENGKEEMALSITDKIFKQLELIGNENADDCDKLLQKGQYFFMRGEFKKALKYYKKILKLNPKMPLMHFHMAMTYFSLGDIDQFNKHYRNISQKELAEYFKPGKPENTQETLFQEEKYIPIDELSREYLNNKTNNN